MAGPSSLQVVGPGTSRHNCHPPSATGHFDKTKSSKQEDGLTNEIFQLLVVYQTELKT